MKNTTDKAKAAWVCPLCNSLNIESSDKVRLTCWSKCEKDLARSVESLLHPKYETSLKLFQELNLYCDFFEELGYSEFQIRIHRLWHDRVMTMLDAALAAHGKRYDAECLLRDWADIYHEELSYSGINKSEFPPDWNDEIGWCE